MTQDRWDDDAALAAELRRRAASASLSHDWAQRELLPTVASGVASATQRVNSSRLPALAGLAGVFAILLLLVVAIPRLSSPPVLVDQTPDRGAQPTAPQTTGPVARRLWSSQEFATAVRAGHLRAATVLVDGSITPVNTYGGNLACITAEERSCLMGRLEFTDPSVDVNSSPINTTEQDPAHTTQSNRGWPWVVRPSAPVMGTLVLSVDAQGEVEFVGIEASLNESPLSPQDAVRVDAASLERNDVILVDGSLVAAFGLPPSCPAPNNYVPGLPIRGCDPSSIGELRVQDGAYFDWAPDPSPRDRSTPEPRPGVYVVGPRLEGGSCPGDATPCWQLEIVGRLMEQSGQPEPTATRSPEQELPTPVSIACTSEDLDVSIAGGTNRVAGCSVFNPEQRLIEGDSVVTNPSADVSRLRVEWVPFNGCIDRAHVEMTPHGEGFQLDITEGPWVVACLGPSRVVGFEMSLLAPVRADSLAVSVRLEGDKATEPPTQPAIFECVTPPIPPGMTTDPGPVPRVVDESGLVSSCAQIDVIPELDGPISVSNLFEPNTIEVVWQDGNCDAAIVFTFRHFSQTGDFGLAGERPSTCTNDGQGSLPIAIRFRQPGAAEDIHASLTDAEAVGPCGHTFTEVSVPLPTFVDETGLVESCSFVDLPIGRPFGIPVIDDVDDPVDLHYHINWDSNACTKADTLTLGQANGRYLFTLERESHDQCKMVSRRRLMLTLSQPVDVSLIDFIEAR